MAIILNRLNPGNDKTKLIELLTKSDEKLKQIVYHGVTEAIARTYAANADVTIPRVNLTIELNNIINTINHLTIIDTSLLTHMLTSKFFLYYNMYLRNDSRNPYEWNSILDVFGISTCYSKEDVDLINNSMSLYRDAYVIGHDWYVTEYIPHKGA